MATQQSTVQACNFTTKLSDTRHSFDLAIDGLFRQGFTRNDIRCLPFVKDTKTERKFWSCPKETDYTKDCETGIMFAAAYLIYRRHNGHLSLPLAWIVKEMPNTGGFVVGFLSHLELYFGGHAELMSDSDIERDASTRISKERAMVKDTLSKQFRSRLGNTAYAPIQVAVKTGFEISAKWEKDDNTDFDVVTTTAVLGQTPAYRLAEKDYRGTDAEPIDGETDDDFARRLFAARCFAAGFAAAKVTT